jgi:hypothetical protein
VTFPEDVDKSNRSFKFFNRKLILAIIIVAAAGITFGIWFLFTYSDNAIDTSDNFLPPNCYSINGKQTCPSPKS